MLREINSKKFLDFTDHLPQLQVIQQDAAKQILQQQQLSISR